MLQNINSQPKTDIKHHFPVSVGITVQKELNNRLALETGLVYTYLSSDLTAGGAAYYTQNQQLHYLGITVKTKLEFLKSAISISTYREAECWKNVFTENSPHNTK